MPLAASYSGSQNLAPLGQYSFGHAVKVRRHIVGKYLLKTDERAGLFGLPLFYGFSPPVFIYLDNLLIFYSGFGNSVAKAPF